MHTRLLARHRQSRYVCRMAKLEVIRIDEQTEPLWEELAKTSAQGGEFLYSDNLRTMAAHETPRAELVRLAVIDPDQEGLLAGWALLVRRRLGIRYSSNFPLFYSGPMLAPPLDRDGDRKLHSKRLDVLNILSRAAKDEIDVCQCELPPDFPDIRGFVYGGFDVLGVACHIWTPSDDESCWSRMNRSKRNEANRIKREKYTFGWLPMNESSIAAFNRLHDHTLAKLSWQAPSSWCESLAAHTFEMGKAGVCRLFGAFAPGETEKPEAIVSVLFNSARKTAYLWRMGVAHDKPGLVPALYASAGDAIHEEVGRDWDINFGGSPLVALSRFKDYLGATPTFHCQLEWQRPGWAWAVWELGYGAKTRLERYRHRLLKHICRRCGRGGEY